MIGVSARRGACFSGMLVATQVGQAAAACSCATGTGNTWNTDRACGSWGTDTVLRDAIFPKVDQDCVDGETECKRECQMRHDDVRNRCPDTAPKDEYTGFVWCDCMDANMRVIQSSTQAECLRTEGLKDDQAAAYQAAGINIMEYECQCCSCQATLKGVPKVGTPGKTCDNDNVDPDCQNCECANTFYAYLALLTFLVFCAWLGVVLNKKHEAANEEEAKKAAKKSKKPAKDDDS
jgi:hypothetical protein